MAKAISILNIISISQINLTAIDEKEMKKIKIFLKLDHHACSLLHTYNQKVKKFSQPLPGALGLIVAVSEETSVNPVNTIMMIIDITN